MIAVFDFDGTIAIGNDKEVSNLHPNKSIIALCNQLYEDGNYIKICTARGSKSCHTIEQRIEKYHKIISYWLASNKVQFHELSFNKEYGDIYIDDRAHNVEENYAYMKLDAGFTNNKVRRFGNKVIKKTEKSIQETNWMKYASNMGINVPKITHTDSDTMIMEYIDGFYCKDYKINASVLSLFSKSKEINNATYDDYIIRIKNHLDKNQRIINSKKLISLLESIYVRPTFGHGDFSVTNLLFKNGLVYVIDPIFNEDVFQSYIIDIAKNLFSILFYLKDHSLYEESFEFYIYKFTLDERTIKILIASECVRVATYNKKYNDIANNLIEAL